jgi:hypothetical protein
MRKDNHMIEHVISEYFDGLVEGGMAIGGFPCPVIASPKRKG